MARIEAILDPIALPNAALVAGSAFIADAAEVDKNAARVITGARRSAIVWAARMN